MLKYLGWTLALIPGLIYIGYKLGEIHGYEQVTRTPAAYRKYFRKVFGKRFRANFKGNMTADYDVVEGFIDDSLDYAEAKSVRKFGWSVVPKAEMDRELRVFYHGVARDYIECLFPVD